MLSKGRPSYAVGLNCQLVSGWIQFKYVSSYKNIYVYSICIKHVLDSIQYVLDVNMY